ncbi:MAG: hypothetical protein ACI935_003917 [Moritella dasanensis]|jgi:hypothetical protein
MSIINSPKEYKVNSEEKNNVQKTLIFFKLIVNNIDLKTIKCTNKKTTRRWFIIIKTGINLI